MIRHAICVVSVVLAACSGDGVSIEVHADLTGAKRVELYVVDGLCTTDAAQLTPCPQLKTPSASGYLDGEVYTREDGHVFAAPVESDGIAYFTIRSNGDKTRVPLAIAVGFDGDDRRVGAVLLPFEVYTTDYMRVRVTLETVIEDQVTGRAQTDGLRAETWYEDSTGIGCLALESTHDGRTDRKFIVPADDLDCDGWVGPDECDSIWPHHGPDDDDVALTFTCVDEESVSNGSKRCLLGDAPCIDGEGAPECTPVRTNGNEWCVPSALCDPICKGSSNPQCLYGALKRPTLPPLAHPAYVHCSVPIEMEGESYAVCRGGVSVDIVAPWVTPMAPATAVCNALMLGRVTSTQIGPFTTEILSSTPTRYFKTVIEASCLAALQVGGLFPPNTELANALPEHVFKLDLTNGTSIIVPIVVQLDPFDSAGCETARGECRLVTPLGTGVDESLNACLRP